MRIRAQIGMVLNLDKCIGCHTCSVTCKNVWTTRQGMEYAWFNNVETKPGTGYPTDWENQEHYQGGWKLDKGALHPRMGSKAGIMKGIFANPHLPQIDDYYEPFTFNYSVLHKQAKFKTPPSARPYSMITGKLMDKIEKGPNWEDNLGGTFAKRSQDRNFEQVQKEILREFENAFMLYLPRLCEHCLNPTCVAACPSGAIYKREEDGIVLIDQDACRGWRECVSACPYKKVYFNWQSKKSEKCTLCFPKIENGEPTICSESCVGRIRYLGVMLYDQDQIKSLASTPETEDLYEAQLKVFLDPHDPEVIKEARKQGMTENYLKAAAASPVYKMVMDWKLALPLHPEFRTLPMVWYIPPLSPVQTAVDSGELGINGILPDVESLRIPIKYLANLFTGGKEKPVTSALKKMLAMRAWMRAESLEESPNPDILQEAGLSEIQVSEMYRYLALADYKDRYVLPTRMVKSDEDAYREKAEKGFDTNNANRPRTNLFGGI